MKGFVSFFLLLIICTALIAFAQQTSTSNLRLEEIKNELIKAEEANKQRTILENNTDLIIKAKLEEQINQKNFNREKAKQEINKTLAIYLKNKADIREPFKEKQEITTDLLNPNSSTQIIKIKNIIYAEYSFTSNNDKTLAIISNLGNKIKINFQLPAGYTQKIIRMVIN